MSASNRLVKNELGAKAILPEPHCVKRAISHPSPCQASVVRIQPRLPCVRTPFLLAIAARRPYR